MQLRRTVPLASLILALGCGGTTAPTSPAVDNTDAPPTATATQVGAGVETVAGVYTIDLDLDALNATVLPKHVREGQANDDLYLLPITNFLRPNSLSITGVDVSGTTVDLHYTVTHPFAGPSDPTAPATAANRVDLGISGRVLFLLDVPSATGNTYFDEGASGSVIANTTMVVNPDSYFQPRAMLQTAGTANTFPYKLLVDETDVPNGSRIDVSNGGDVTGNYGSDGWTRDELGPGAPFNQWSGYGVLHQGQASQRVLSLDLEQLEGGGIFTFDAAIIAKYNDPRGGLTATEKRANRLPPATPDANRFAYRMPHGALDVQQIRFGGAAGTGFVANEASSAILNFHLEDWDARAIETAQDDLALEPDVTLVAKLESGLPAFAVSIPDIFGSASVIDTWDPLTDVVDDDSGFGGDPGQDSGRPGDGLFYTREVLKSAGTGESEGTFTGLARAVDLEPSALVLPLDADLQVITGNAPGPEIYQSFTVEMTATPEPDFGWAKLFDPGVDKWVEATGVTIDGDSNVIACGFFHHTIDFGGGIRTSLGDMDNFVVKYNRKGEYQWDYHWGSDSPDNYRSVRTDPDGNVYAGGSYDGTTDFDGAGPLAPFPPNGREDAFIMRLNGDTGAFEWVRVFGDLALFPEAEVGKNMASDDTGVYLGGFFRSGGLKFATNDPDIWNCTTAGAFIVKLQFNGDLGWSKAFDGGLHDEIRGTAADGTGGLLAVCDFYSDTINFGGGDRFNTDTSGKTDDMAIVRLDAATGDYVVDHHFNGNSIEQPQALAANGNYVAVTGHTWSTDLDLGGGEPLPHAGSSDFYWGRFDSTTLVHQWSGMLGSENYDPGFGVGVDPSGAVYVGGLFQGPIDFGFGPVTPMSQDGFLYKLDPNGDPAWVHTWGGPIEFVRGSSIDCDAVSVAIVGVHGVGGPTDFEPGAPVTELTSSGISGVLIRDLSGGTW